MLRVHGPSFLEDTLLQHVAVIIKEKEDMKSRGETHKYGKYMSMVHIHEFKKIIKAKKFLSYEDLMECFPSGF